MIEKLIALCIRNKFLTVVIVVSLFGAGLWSLRRIPLDALPDLSDVQVIVYTNWEGQNPNLIEDQVTYPIVSALISAPRVKTVRGYSFFGFSYSHGDRYQDGTDLYWARSRARILERPEGAATKPERPDAPAGWGFQYVLGTRQAEFVGGPANLSRFVPCWLADRESPRSWSADSEAMPDRGSTG